MTTGWKLWTFAFALALVVGGAGVTFYSQPALAGGGECNAFGDTDGDQICDDGDDSGVVGDNPCPDGTSANCDDNCPNVGNASQVDTNGNGRGNACECGDATGDGNVNVADARDNMLAVLGQKGFGNLCETTGNDPANCNVADARQIMLFVLGQIGLAGLQCPQL